MIHNDCICDLLFVVKFLMSFLKLHVPVKPTQSFLLWTNKNLNLNLNLNLNGRVSSQNGLSPFLSI